jgi:hypothetical protein
MTPTAIHRAIGSLLLALAAGSAAAQGNQQVEVVGTSPLPGLGVDRDWLPYAAQVARREQIDRAQADTLTDHLARRAAGVQVNDIQGSPYQGDLTLRGHRASGLLGAAQGLSVVLDGVRINEPFGDVVNWDLVPEFMLRSVTLMPGANPAFGLNTLGGAVVMQTASGQTAPRAARRRRLRQPRPPAAGPEPGRQQCQRLASPGGRHGVRRKWLARPLARARGHAVRQGIGPHAGDPLAWELSLLAGRSRLTGNGLVPSLSVDDGETEADLLASRYRAVFTHPDRTRNELAAGVQPQPRLQRHAAAAGPGLCATAAAAPSTATSPTTPTRQRRERVAQHHRTTPAACGLRPAWPAQRRPPVAAGRQPGRSRVHYRQLEQEGSLRRHPRRAGG